MRTSFGLLLAIAFCVFTAGCNSSSVEQEPEAGTDRLAGRLTLTGSSTVAPLVTEIAKRFESLHPGVRIDVQTGGSGQGIADARSGVADIGMASRDLKSDEAGLVAHQIASDGVGLIVHRSNPIQELTTEQITAIYLDQINRWSELSGNDQDIVVVHKAEGRATLEVFLQHFRLMNPNIKADVIVGENEHAIRTVSATENAIGYVSIGTAEADIEAGVPIRLLPLAGVEANSENVASGEYPMSRPLNLITTETPSALALEFIRFCQSKEVHDLIKAQYFVPPVGETNAAE